MSIEIGELNHDKTVPSSVKTTRKVDTHSKPKKEVIYASEKSNDGNSESITDVMDSLIKIFEPDYEPEEDMGDFSILNEPQMAEPQVKKRKRNDVSRNNEGKYQCQHCDYGGTKSSSLKKHLKAIHKDVCYPCTQCSNKATETGNLKKHVEVL